MFKNLKKRGNPITTPVSQADKRKTYLYKKRQLLLAQQRRMLIQRENIRRQQINIQYQKKKMQENQRLKNILNKNQLILDKFKKYIFEINENSNNYKYIHNDSDLKSIHRFNCYKYTETIRNIIIKNFGDNDNIKETILIEFRPLPNLEFLIRNTIIKLPNWNHTVICGNNNYKFIKKLCDFICKDSESKINIIKLEIDNLTPSQYSQLLTTKDFWEKIKGTKILLYQEDTMLFKNNIDTFLEYDYIGAPWPLNQDDNSHGVGNGGFSLRTKEKMIECIEKINPEDLKLGNSTKMYMESTKSTFVPEDVYFSKALIDFNLGNVATRDIAVNFSQESVFSKSPLGGHNFWVAEGKITKKYITTLNLSTNYYNISNHRYGWKGVIENLITNNIILGDSDIDLIDCMESYFIWDKKVNPKREWYGILHFADNLPNLFERICTLDGIFDNLGDSLKNCKGIITLSGESKKNVIKKLKKINYNIPVYSLKHPIQIINRKFNLDSFISKNSYNIIQLGKQYRRVSDIYMINSHYKKIWLSGTKNKNRCYTQLKNECNYLNIQPKNNVNCYYTKTLDEYDELLLNNIIIIPLWNATANNSLLECMEANIPAFISKLPSTLEYLGDKYPMFYENIKDIEPIINNIDLLYQKYKETYNYLINLDKTTIHYEYFNSELLKIIN
jgi:hypothetical protein